MKICKCLFLFPVLVLSFITGCDMYVPTTVNDKPIQVTQDQFSQDFAVADITDGRVETIAQDYAHSGGDGMSVTVLYDQKSRINTALNASGEASRIARAIRLQGVETIQTQILPVHDLGDDARVVISYAAYSALPPRDCTMLAGVEDMSKDYTDEYRLGCTVSSLTARQVAKPKDLLGVANSDTKTEGRSASNIVETYRFGAPVADLNGESASGEN